MRLVLNRAVWPPAARARFAFGVALVGAVLGCAPGATAEATASTPPSQGTPLPAASASSANGSGPQGPSASAAIRPSRPGASSRRTTSVTARATVRKAPPRRRPPRVVLPPADGRFDYQLGGAYPPPARTAIVERDRTVAPFPGSYGICYVNAFQTQPEDLWWWEAHHPRVLLAGADGYVEDPDWPGEVLFDTSTRAKRAELLSVIGPWIDGCATRGYRAVEPDNLDSFTRSEGRLTAGTNTAFAALLVAHADARGLAVAQKNTAELASTLHTIGFDVAVAEECQVYRECDAYTAVYGLHVLEVEYTDNGLDAFTAACQARRGRISIVLRDRDLVAAGDPGYAYSSC